MPKPLNKRQKKEKAARSAMIDAARNLGIAWQQWASEQSMTWMQSCNWTNALEVIADLTDPTGALLYEFRENGIC